MADGASEAPTRTPGTQTGPGPDILTVPVEVGRRALIVANLGLKPEATPATTGASSGLARALDTWEGPGLVVIAGNLFDLTGAPDGVAATSAALAAHPRLTKAFEAFASSEDRRVISIPGTTDSALAVGVPATLGIEVAAACELHMSTAAGVRVVRVEGAMAPPTLREAPDREAWASGATAGSPAPAEGRRAPTRGAPPSRSPPTPRPNGRTASNGWRTRPAPLAS